MLRRRGLGGATLRAVERDGLAAVYSRHRSIHPRPAPKLIVHHERVVEAIMAWGAVLPLRFGTELAREQELADVLRDRRDELLRSLDHVRGSQELGVRVIPHDRPPGRRPTTTTGRDYLLARVREHGRRERAISEVHAELAAVSRSTRVRQPRPPAILVGTYLVDAERVGEFRRRADQLAQRQAGVQITVTGPWPPYSFATEEPA
jgi:hypothetical protein